LIKRIGLFGVCLFIVSAICFAAVPTHLVTDVTLSDKGELIEGKKAVTIKLYVGTSEIEFWTESQTNIEFLNGNATLKLGADPENLIDDSFFDNDDLEVQVRVNQKQIRFPFVSVPFSIRSKIANSAEEIEDQTIIVFDDVSKRVGVGTLAPLTVLDIDGGIRISAESSSGSEPDGTVQWTGTDYQVRKAGEWKSMMYVPNDTDQSKWATGDASIFVAASKVGIGIGSPVFNLDVQGDGIMTSSLTLGDGIRAQTGIKSSQYSFDSNGVITANSLVLSGSNQWVGGDLTFTGNLIGDGSQLTGILDAAIRDEAMTGVKFKSDSITAAKLATGSVTEFKIPDGVVTLDKFDVSVIGADQIANATLTGAHFAAGSVTLEKLVLESVTTGDIPTGWMTQAHLADSAVTTAKLGDLSITTDKITPNSIDSEVIATGAITTTKISANAVGVTEMVAGSLDDRVFGGAVPVIHGGTGSAGYTVGSILHGDSTGTSIIENDLVWDVATQRLGLGTVSPDSAIHVKQSTSPVILVENTGAFNSGFRLKNTLSEWRLYVDPAGNFVVYDKDNELERLSIDATGRVSLGVASPKEMFSIGNAITIGDKTISGVQAGLIYFKDGIIQGRLSSIWSYLGTPTSGVSFGTGVVANTSSGVALGGHTINANGAGASILGGKTNTVTGDFSSIGGGESNLVLGESTIIFGGQSHAVTGDGTVILGGYNNSVSGNYSVIVGGASNNVTTIHSMIGGGHENTITANAGTIGGGGENLVSGEFSVVAGGFQNTVTANRQVRGGSDINLLAASFIGGGSQNYIVGQGSHIGGGLHNQIKGSENSIGAGSYNQIQGSGSVISGGRSQSIQGIGSVVFGGEAHQVNGSYSTVQGGDGHQIQGDMTTVGGGMGHRSEGYGHVISGGNAHRVSGIHGTVSGGEKNVVTGHYGSVSGGQANIVTGKHAAVLGGYSNESSGEGSVAMGRYAKSNHDGSFVWSDGAASMGRNTERDNQFIVKASGGVAFYTGVGDGGVVLDSGSGSWAVVSDRNKKTKLKDVDGESILTKLESMTIQEWEYKSKQKETKKDRHIGPMAQDFYAAYGLGRDEKHISTVDADGIALVSIQALSKREGRLQTLLEALQNRTKSDLRANKALIKTVVVMENRTKRLIAKTKKKEAVFGRIQREFLLQEAMMSEIRSRYKVLDQQLRSGS
jgi:hypothetical protein